MTRQAAPGLSCPRHGADDEIRTRDPHLGKNVMAGVRTVRPLLCSTPQSAKPSVQFVCSVQFVYRYTIPRALYLTGVPC